MSVSSTRVSRMPGQSAGKHASACGATDSTDASLTCPFRASPRIASTEASPAEIAKELADVSPVEIAKAGASGQNAIQPVYPDPDGEAQHVGRCEVELMVAQVYGAGQSAALLARLHLQEAAQLLVCGLPGVHLEPPLLRHDFVDPLKEGGVLLLGHVNPLAEAHEPVPAITHASGGPRPQHLVGALVLVYERSAALQEVLDGIA
eukprot:CAMPEP_0171173328 /NCGR_PEP_ID=MMETSP0790-20130122/10168_1 /TAXON_ID=2925 /ORGANISM="Alexandrium catenella, Strain OF101" /LENGTH=204 /DNA_ID=CAMNT_0011638193 /DNA_START=14 /DNA_END=629 /DNA_ORIENTATION=+